MPFYEFVCLAKPALPRANLSRMLQRVGELVMGDGGIVTDVKSYGEQHLAYDIRKPALKLKTDKAHIWQMNFVANPVTLAKVDRELKLNTEAIRWLVTKRGERSISRLLADVSLPHDKADSSQPDQAEATAEHP